MRQAVSGQSNGIMIGKTFGLGDVEAEPPPQLLGCAAMPGLRASDLCLHLCS